jgi:hypothetical protein
MSEATQPDLTVVRNGATGRNETALERCDRNLVELLQ